MKENPDNQSPNTGNGASGITPPSDGGDGGDWHEGGNDGPWREGDGESWKSAVDLGGSGEHSSLHPVGHHFENIDVAKRVNKGMHADLKKHPEWEKVFDNHSNHIRWAERLSEPRLEAKYKKIIFKKMQAQYPKRFTHVNLDNITEANIRDARDFLHNKLEVLTENAHQMRNGPNVKVLIDAARKKGGGEVPIVEHSTAAPKVFKTSSQPVEVETNISFGPIRRVAEKIFDWHQGKLKNLQPDTRMMFGWGEFMLGSALTGMGTRTFRQVYGGIKEKTIQKIDEKGNLSIAFEIEPMSKAERTIKGALALGEVAAGIGGMAGGLYNAMKPY